MLAMIPFPDISPEIFSIEIGNFTFALRWYALAYIAGFLAAWAIVVALMKRPVLWGREAAPMAPGMVEGLLTWVIIGVILGGRLGFVLFYQPGYYLRNPVEILFIWQGGMAFHGGLAGAALAGWLFARRHSVAPMRLADAMAVSVPVGLFLGRIANFINAELWGRPTTMPWGVIFPGPAAQSCPWGWEGPCARHPTQLYEAGLEGLVLGLVLAWLVWRRGALKLPGLTLGVFLAGYGLSRFVVEFWREADAQFITPDNPLGHVIRLGDLGLSMGQLLSLPMILLGLGLILWARRGAPAGPPRAG
ncbi:prolipoprotein diacylglyceryl transferase [Alkalilacustris brevis]|uniref:prolipoprotein diacylglyceryl transferase n=1 Tax=Alkalilacustris brevis TaxID=2026338 RepID=UPI000E0CED4A|nr:prolipoprotein diacylglyceryl transferase [Alkalilacustris brevis]